MQDHQIKTLANGIRIVHKQVQNSKIAHCGFILDIGSRDESPAQKGLAHFWEHMAFKGTQKRKSYQIINKLDALGGELNAYTTKENICFYASVLNDHTEKAIDILTDITFHSTFPEKQIEKERNIILEEMSLYVDAPEDAIQDDLDELIFTGHPLGNNILGTKESVNSFRQSDFFHFIRTHLSTNRLIFASVSGLPFGKVLRMAEKFLADLPPFESSHKRDSFGNYIQKTKIDKKHIQQAHCAIGNIAFNNQQKERYAFSLLVNLLGGPAMNSRLNMLLREKHGYVYSVEASFSAYFDTGLFSLFFATEKKQLYRSVELILKELARVAEAPVSAAQLHKAKVQYIGQMAMAEENHMSLMLMLGKSLLLHDRIESFEEVVAKMRRISQADVQDVAQQVFDKTKLSFLYYLPKD